MSLILKTNAVGIDAEIDRLQNRLFDLLSDDIVNWDCNHRIYEIPKDGKMTPHRYKSNDEYDEVFMNDNFACTSFFMVGSESDVSDGNPRFDVSIIFQTLLNKVFPDIVHRADEEMKSLVYNAINKTVYRDQLVKITTGIDGVYREFDKSQIELNDMSKYHVMRFDFKNIGYSPLECCENC